TSAGGTGLGLAIAAELVHLHGGTIALEDSANGAVFRIEI
ncbi:MAG: cell wall metabolism sensor histidine kinase WalK, partial [Nitrospiraceae bacterium]|nr:cell wall metabolism sensor histidine kinase WalK [Nitrospiraceae bacterium]